jgi:hypothetical protein
MPPESPATNAPSASHDGEEMPRTISACASSASASPGISLKGRTPEIEKSGATDSRTVAPIATGDRRRDASSGNAASSARNNIAADMMAIAPPATDQRASATASTRAPASDGASHDIAASDRRPSAM